MTYLALNCLKPLKYIESYFRKSKAIFKFSAIFEKNEYLDFLTPLKPLAIHAICLLFSACSKIYLFLKRSYYASFYNVKFPYPTFLFAPIPKSRSIFLNKANFSLAVITWPSPRSLSLSLN